jgi:CheY-like chemotaxis protein
MHTPRLLFVEDDPDDIDLLTKSLQANSIDDFLILDSGARALAYLDALADGELPHLLVVDLNMPGMSGYDLIRKLKAEPRYQAIPVIILTTSQRSALIEEALQQGASAYFHKPFPSKTSMPWYRSYTAGQQLNGRTLFLLQHLYFVYPTRSLPGDIA